MKGLVSDWEVAANHQWPFRSAESWDNVGLILGRRGDAVRGAIVAIDLSFEVLRRASQIGANLVICHHPPIFNPVKAVIGDKNSAVYETIRQGVSVLVLHSNFDLHSTSLNRTIASTLGFRYHRPLSAVERHFGYGLVASRISRQPTNLVFHQLLDRVKDLFRLESAVVAGPGLADPRTVVARLAFSPGSGSGFVKSAIQERVDVFVTGELGYHHMLDAGRNGVTTVQLGHSYSEKFFLTSVLEWGKRVIGKRRVLIDSVHEKVQETSIAAGRK